MPVRAPSPPRRARTARGQLRRGQWYQAHGQDFEERRQRAMGPRTPDGFVEPQIGGSGISARRSSAAKVVLGNT